MPDDTDAIVNGDVNTIRQSTDQ